MNDMGETKEPMGETKEPEQPFIEQVTEWLSSGWLSRGSDNEDTIEVLKNKRHTRYKKAVELSLKCQKLVEQNKKRDVLIQNIKNGKYDHELLTTNFDKYDPDSWWWNPFGNGNGGETYGTATTD